MLLGTVAAFVLLVAIVSAAITVPEITSSNGNLTLTVCAGMVMYCSKRA